MYTALRIFVVDCKVATDIATMAKKIVKSSCYKASKIKIINLFKRVSFKKFLNAL